MGPAAQGGRGRRHHKRSTTWAEQTEIIALGIEQASIVVGDIGDPTAPVVVRLRFPPGVVVDPHAHGCDYAEIILEGTQRVGRRWYPAGHVRIVTAGTVYGPLEAGPEGCTVLVVFREGSASRALPPRPGSTVGVHLDQPGEDETSPPG